MTGHHAATFDDALRWLDLFLGWSVGADWMPLRVAGPTQQGVWHHRCGVPGSGERLVNVVRAADERFNEQVEIGIPAVRVFGGVREATAFWVRVEGTDQNRRLGWFKPAPSLILREGSSSRRVAVWPLAHPVRWVGINRGNRRIAHRLRAPKKHSEPENLWIPAPGTCLRAGRTRPVPIVVERLELDVFMPLDIVGLLKDPPAADAWMQANRRVPS